VTGKEGERAEDKIVERLHAALGDAPDPAALRNYVAAPGREPVESYGSIREFLRAHWEIPVVETEDQVAELEQLGGARSIGRCGVRLLDLVGKEDTHIVVRRDPGGDEHRMLWTLLHELGHLAWHFELLQTVSAVYQRLCLNPGLETELAAFSYEQGRRLRGLTELEADLFALDWLLPRWWFSEDGGVALPDGLTPDGHRYLALRRAFGSSPGQPSRAQVDVLNRAGADERGRSEGALRAGATRWRRAGWLLWNRDRFEGPFSGELIDEYGQLVGGGGRYVPELRQPKFGEGEIEPDVTWLPRVSAEDAEAAVDEPQWMPLLIASEGSRYPEYNIPIRPLPTRESRDSRLRWSHMFKPPTQKALPLETWIGRAREQGAGLLLFARTPAERALDAEGVPRP
jgi:hypothetical protein